MVCIAEQMNRSSFFFTINLMHSLRYYAISDKIMSHDRKDSTLVNKDVALKRADTDYGHGYGVCLKINDW